MHVPRTLGCWSLALALALNGACSRVAAPDVAQGVAPDGAPPAPTHAHTLVVLATDSLRAPFTALAARYGADHPGTVVELRCAGAATLLADLLAGARADVVAFGDASTMSRVAAAGLLASGSVAELARNRIAIAVAANNPRQVASLRDLARTDLRVGLGRRSSSIGRYGRWVLSRLPLPVTPHVEADTAAALVAAVAAGELDAAIVYATSGRDGANVTQLAVPETDNAAVLYAIGTTRDAREPASAAAFCALARGGAGRAVFDEHGFLPPGAKDHGTPASPPKVGAK